MRAMTEHAPSMANIRVPIELLREWTLVAVQSRDCALLGRAMTLASAAGHSLQDVSSILHKSVDIIFREKLKRSHGRAYSSSVYATGKTFDVFFRIALPFLCIFRIFFFLGPMNAIIIVSSNNFPFFMCFHECSGAGVPGFSGSRFA